MTKTFVKLFASMIKASMCALVINEQTMTQQSQKSFIFRFSGELEQTDHYMGTDMCVGGAVNCV